MKISGLVLDLDGVIWRGDEPIGDLPAIFQQVREAGLGTVFVTNNSTKTVDSYLEKFALLGLEVEPWQLITSAEATASYLRGLTGTGKRVYVIGERGLEDTLRAHGFEISMGDASAVVVGLDRNFTYAKLAAGMALVYNGAALVGTNPDTTLPVPGGLVPGAGAILASIEAATGRKATVIGKPGIEMFNQAISRLRILPHESLAVGDRLDTDIAGGQASGCLTAVVLTGAATRAQAEAWVPKPTFIEADLAALVGTITKSTG